MLNGGRPVIIFETANLVDESSSVVTVSYTFEPKRIYVEPLMLIGSFFGFFVVCSVLSRVFVKGKPKTHSA